jgi:hypothetical protein
MTLEAVRSLRAGFDAAPHRGRPFERHLAGAGTGE